MQANLLVLYSEGFELAVSLFQFKAGSETLSFMEFSSLPWISIQPDGNVMYG